MRGRVPVRCSTFDVCHSSFPRSCSLFVVCCCSSFPRSHSSFHVPRSLFVVPPFLFVVRHSTFVVSPIVGGDVAVSTRNPPCEQWLAGLGQVLGHSLSSALHAPHLHPTSSCSWRWRLSFRLVFRQLGGVATWWGVLTSY
jgi:hypothetical protein